MKKLQELPKFKSEDDKREFWATHSFLDYYDIDKFELVPAPMSRKETVLLNMLAEMTPEVERLSREKIDEHRRDDSPAYCSRTPAAAFATGSIIILTV